jgi:hypothetical protein
MWDLPDRALPLPRTVIRQSHIESLNRHTGSKWWYYITSGTIVSEMIVTIWSRTSSRTGDGNIKAAMDATVFVHHWIWFSCKSDISQFQSQGIECLVYRRWVRNIICNWKINCKSFDCECSIAWKLFRARIQWENIRLSGDKETCFISFCFIGSFIHYRMLFCPIHNDRASWNCDSFTNRFDNRIILAISDHWIPMFTVSRCISSTQQQ